jgi:trans-aconitate methyltransferase
MPSIVRPAAIRRSPRGQTPQIGSRTLRWAGVADRYDPRERALTSPADIDGLRADYDTTPYTSDAFPQSAPGRLAAIAHVFGLDTPAVPTARVLEIGCAAAGNLLPFAATHPQAHVTGIDLSRVQIEQGRGRAAALGLDNLELVEADIAELQPGALGEFDFVIAHGVYSWVPEHVRDALLAAFRGALAPTGIGYLSYNTYPGWKAKEVMRDAMLLATATSAGPAEKARDARGVVDFLAEVAQADGVLARTLAEFKARDIDFGDNYLLHDELETFNAPCYFYEMVGRAGGHGLAFLAEAHPEAMFPANHGPRVAEYLAEKCGGVQVLVEQYLDFVLNRAFRESLLIHAERAPQIRYAPDPARFGALHFAAWTPPVDGPTVLDHSRQEYEVADGATLFTNDPGLKATLEALNARWPWTLPHADLVRDVHDRLVAAGHRPSPELAGHVDGLLGVLIVQGHARYRLDPVVSEHAEPLHLDAAIRRMADLTRADAAASIFNLWHEPLIPSPADRRLLTLLDGTRDRDALLAALRADHERDPIALDGAELADHIGALPDRLREWRLA